MNVSIDQLVKSLLQKESLEQCSLPELTAFAESNPYFGAAQLLLAKKIQTELPEKFEEQYQKTLLYFHNPLWVEHLLNETGSALIHHPPKEDTAAPAPVKEPVAEILQPEEPVLQEIPEPVAPEMITQQKPEEIMLPAAIETPAPQPQVSASGANELSFEPYHMVDYFASQGIRFKEEDKPSDEFGKQLKSFTDWLKTLKRLPVTELGNAISAQAEQKVEQMAGQSITEREILTEAMAEVWEKQGNTLKAIGIYSKLSLLEPAKSPYFAAKIEALKKKN
ncbi:MAG: hypothetical protein HYZ15_05375 [Sphingobacteriales bacterium]|nr:hypothetical protein [Sphingobacteriales bacterium]